MRLVYKVSLHNSKLILFLSNVRSRIHIILRMLYLEHVLQYYIKYQTLNLI